MVAERKGELEYYVSTNSKFSQKILKTLSHALETLIFEFLVEKCVEVVKWVIF